MSPWLVHLLLGSVGLLLAVVGAQLVLVLWRRRPLASYRLSVCVLFAGLSLPALQLAAEGWDAPKALPFAHDLAELRAGLADQGKTGAVASPEAPSTSPALEDWELLLLGALDAAAAEATVPAPETGASLAAGESWLTAERLRAALGAVAAVYLAGVLVLLVRTGRRLFRTRRLLLEAEPVRDPAVLAVWRTLAPETPLAGRIRLLTSPEVSTPMCFGLRRPAIVLPAEVDPALDPDVLRCVLLHELIHLERRDTWVMLAQALLRSVFWFHPAAWFLCRRIDALRELSCDHLVVRRTGRRKRYAEALVEYAFHIGAAVGAGPPQPSIALLPWQGAKSQLSRRIEMLVSLTSPRRLPWTSVPAAASLFACLWGGQIVLASALSPGQEPEACPECPPTAPLPPAAATPELPALPGFAPLPGFVPLPAREPTAPAPLLPKPWASPGTLPQAVAPPGVPLPSLLPGGRPLPPASGFRSGVPLPTQEGEAPVIGVYLGDAGDDAIRIQGIVPDSLAQRSDLRAGDVIVRINGRPASRDELDRAKRRLTGGSMELTIERNGERIHIELDGREWPRRTRGRSATGGISRYRSDDAARRAQAAEEARRGATRARRDVTERRSERDLDRARELLEQALQQDPDNASIRRALDSLHEAQDRAAVRGATRERMRREDERAVREEAQRAEARGAYEDARRLYQQRGRRDSDAEYERAREAYREATRDRARETREVRERARSRPPEEHGRGSQRRGVGAGRGYADDTGRGYRAPERDFQAELERTRALLEQRQQELEELMRQLDELKRQRDDQSSKATGDAAVDGHVRWLEELLEQPEPVAVAEPLPGPDTLPEPGPRADFEPGPDAAPEPAPKVDDASDR